MKSTTVKPTHKPVKQYYQALEEFAAQGVTHEMAVRSAFQHLLEDTGRRFGWTLIAELSFEGRKGTVRPDGTFSTVNRWENGRRVPSRLAVRQIEQLRAEIGEKD